MPLFREILDVRQIPGEHRRRWFEAGDMDLIVWLDDAGAPIGFQLCYDKGAGERALTYRTGGGISHCVVDDGESERAGYKSTPVLAGAALLNAERVRRKFLEASDDLPAPIVELVTEQLR